MKKIRNFKVNLRVREIARVIKKLTNTPDMSVEAEEAVQKACHFYSKFIKPSVVYDTFSKESMTLEYEEDAPAKWIARSVFFITIGSSLEEEYKKNEEAFGQYSGTIVSAIAVDALEQAKNFTRRLIAAEASSENCDVSRSVALPQDLYQKAAESVAADKIDISVPDGKLSPQYSDCGIFYWTPSGRKKSRK